MKRLLIALLLMSLNGGALAAPPEVTIANTPWHPYFGEDLPEYGMAAEIITNAFARSGYRTQFKTRPWSRAILELKHGAHDALATAYHTSERAQLFRFSAPYMHSEVRLYQQKDRGISWADLEDLKPYHIGTVLNNAYSPAFDDADFLQKDAATSETLNIRKLAAGRIDLLVMDRYVFEYLISRNPSYLGQIEALEPALNSSPLHVMFSPQAVDVENKILAFNRGLKAIMADGELQRIISRHLK
ncbi:MAG: transporter substrate-binding domain-containing protein [Halopseudomonas sp.]